MSDLLTPQELQFWLTFLHASHAVKQQLAEDMYRVNGISIGWYDVLINLYRGEDGGLRMQDLAERVFMSNSGLTRLLDRMIEEGLVIRDTCAEDRRVFLAVLTEKGRALLEELLPQHQARIRSYLLQHLTAEEMEVMGNALQRVQAGIATGKSGDC